MIIAAFLVLSIPVGYLLGGKLKNVKNFTTRALGLPVAAFLLEAAAPFLRNRISVPIAQWHWILVTVEYILLFIFCVLNRKSGAVWLILIACVMNYFAIAWYGFQMPVAPYAREMTEMASAVAKIESGEYFRYIIANEKDLFWFLGDVIVVPIPYIGGFASVGDILLGLGSGALFVSWMRTEKPKEARQYDAG